MYSTHSLACSHLPQPFIAASPPPPPPSPPPAGTLPGFFKSFNRSVYCKNTVFSTYVCTMAGYGAFAGQNNGACKDLYGPCIKVCAARTRGNFYVTSSFTQTVDVMEGQVGATTYTCSCTTTDSCTRASTYNAPCYNDIYTTSCVFKDDTAAYFVRGK
jgi:hypothetical protein